MSLLNKQVKQVGLLYVTTILGVLIGVLNSVINTRSLAPELYGDVRYVQNIISFISSLLMFGYFVSGSRLLALSKNEEYSRRIRGIMVVILGLTFVVLMISMTFLYIISEIEGQDNMSPIWLAAIPTCGNVILLSYINNTAQGDNHIGRISAARLLPSLIYCIAAYFIYLYFGATPVRMLLLYNGVSSIILFFIILSTRPSFKDLKNSYIILRDENRAYGFNIYIGALVGVSTGYISGITLGHFCETNANVGFFTLAVTISAPLHMLPAIVGTTFFKRFAKENRISYKVLTSSVAVTVLSCILFVSFISLVVNYLYNESYTSVSTYARWLAIGTCLHGLGDMFNRFLGAHGQGKQIRNASIAGGLSLTVGSFLFVYLWSIDGAVFNSVLGSAIYFLFILFYYVVYVNSNNSKE